MKVQIRPNTTVKDGERTLTEQDGPVDVSDQLGHALIAGGSAVEIHEGPPSLGKTKR